MDSVLKPSKADSKVTHSLPRMLFQGGIASGQIIPIQPLAVFILLNFLLLTVNRCFGNRLEMYKVKVLRGSRSFRR